MYKGEYCGLQVSAILSKTAYCIYAPRLKLKANSLSPTLLFKRLPPVPNDTPQVISPLSIDCACTLHKNNIAMTDTIIFFIVFCFYFKFNIPMDKSFLPREPITITPFPFS